MSFNPIQAIKTRLSKNEKTAYLYGNARFLFGIFIKNFLNLEKLILFLKVSPYTMVSSQRIMNVYELAEKIEKNHMEGAFVECGVWKGGSVAVMAYVAKKYGSNRKIWLFDSFEGLPEPTKEDGVIAQSYALGKTEGKLSSIHRNVGNIDSVKKILFQILRIQEQNVVLQKGWFQDTLPKVKDTIGSITILRLDGDWYESTKVCLENLYDNVIIGGYIIIDDYGHWEGCKRALDEFFIAKNINPDLVKIDETGVYFQKI